MMTVRLQHVFSRSLQLLLFSSLGARPSSPLPCTLIFSNLSGPSLGSCLAVIEKGPCLLSREVGCSRQSFEQHFCGSQSCFLMLSTSTTSIYTHSVSWSFDMLHSTEQFIIVPGLFIRVYSMFGGFSS